MGVFLFLVLFPFYLSFVYTPQQQTSTWFFFGGAAVPPAAPPISPTAWAAPPRGSLDTRPEHTSNLLQKCPLITLRRAHPRADARNKLQTCSNNAPKSSSAGLWADTPTIYAHAYSFRYQSQYQCGQQYQYRYQHQSQSIQIVWLILILTLALVFVLLCVVRLAIEHSILNVRYPTRRMSHIIFRI